MSRPAVTPVFVTPVFPHKHHDHAAGCSSAHPNLPASPTKPLACPDVVLQSRACILSAELLLTPSKILPKSVYLASQGTYPWSASVELVILGVLNASLPSQSPQLEFQPLEFDKLTRNLDHLPHHNTPRSLVLVNIPARIRGECINTFKLSCGFLDFFFF